MLDSSPIALPPPKKLKRTASVASLPSPPPSVNHLKKRANVQKFGSDTQSDSEDEVNEVTSGHQVTGRKLLFPSPLNGSTSSAANDLDNPFLDDHKSKNVRGQLAVDAASSPVVSHIGPVSPPRSRGKPSKVTATLPKTPPPVDQRGRCTASELPVLDEENNPFVVASAPRARRPRTVPDLTEQPTMTYVFKGIKTTISNPNYNLPESVHERSHLPLSHPDYSPPPICVPKRLFPEALSGADDADDEDEQGTNSDSEGTGADPQTPDAKPRMSKLFVDAAGKPILDSGPEDVRGKIMDAREVRRMAVGPVRGRG